MRNQQHHHVSPMLQSMWRARLDALTDRLRQNPDSTWAWLWRMRVRVTTYLIRRYGALEHEASARQTQSSVHPSDLAAPAADSVTNDPHMRRHTVAEVPVDQLRIRAEARRRFAVFLERQTDVGEQVRRLATEAEARAAVAAARDQRRMFLLERVILSTWCSIIIGGSVLMLALFVLHTPDDTWAGIMARYDIWLYVSITLLGLAALLAFWNAVRKLERTMHGEDNRDPEE